MAELIGGLAGKLQGTVGGLFDRSMAFVDRLFPPEKRAELSAKLNKFAKEKPMLASFLLSHLAISGPVLFLFLVLTVTVAVFALVAALLVGLLGAVLFVAGAVGFALIVLLPVLFFTTFIAVGVWLWGLGAYYLLKWFNKKDIPGIHTGLDEGLGKHVDDYARREKKLQQQQHQHQQKKIEGEANGHAKNGEANGHAKGGKGAGVANGVPGGEVVDGVGKATGIDAGKTVGDVKKKLDVGNVTKAADGADVRRKLDVKNVAKVADVADVGNVAKKVDVGNLKGTLGL